MADREGVDVVNHSAVNREKYARAQEYIRSGAWIVDADAGVIHSRRTGRPLRPRVSSQGYVCYGITIPGGSRATVRCIPVISSRVIWEAVHGLIPDGYEINHKDGNKLNNSISNFELATPSENKRHALRMGLRKPACGERTASARLTDPQVREIQMLLAQGLPQSVIGKRYGVTQGTISWINRGKSWKHVSPSDGFQPSQTDGPLRGESNGAARLTDRDVVEIRALLKQGVYQRVIADTFGVSQSLISLINLGRAWAHIV